MNNDTFEYIRHSKLDNGIISWLKELYIDIVCSIFPGIIFVSYLIYIVYTFSPSLDTSWLNDQTSSYSFWVFLSFSFICGFILQRKDVDIPDAVSQIFKAANQRFVAGWTLTIIFSIVFIFFPSSVLIRLYRFYVYRERSCCGFGSKQPGFYFNFTKRNEMEENNNKKGKDGVLSGREYSNKKRNQSSQYDQQYISKWKLFLKLISLKPADFYQEIERLSECKTNGGEVSRDEKYQERESTEQNVPQIKCISKTKFLFKLMILAINPTSPMENEYLWRYCNKAIDCHTHRRKLTNYPYEDFFHAYLRRRGLTYLKKYIFWDNWDDENYRNTVIHLKEQQNIRNRSRRAIDILKMRIRAILPVETEDLVRIETHIRLSSAVWYLTKIIGNISTFIILIKLILIRYFPALLSDISINTSYSIWPYFMILFVSCFLNYSICSFLHYTRLKEVSILADWISIIDRSENLKNKLHFEDFEYIP